MIELGRMGLQRTGLPPWPTASAIPLAGQGALTSTNAAKPCGARRGVHAAKAHEKTQGRPKFSCTPSGGLPRSGRAGGALTLRCHEP